MARDFSLNSKDFGLKLYSRFPPKYREDDVHEKYALKRYLQSCGDGGFSHAIEEWNGLLDIQDPKLVNSSVLHALYTQYGFTLFNGIPEEYLRYLLPRLGEAWAKKGSIDVVEFIVSALSGIKTRTEVTSDVDESITLNVKLEMDYNIGGYFPDPEQFKRILKEFIPFYLQVVLTYAYIYIETQGINVVEEDIHDHVVDTKYTNTNLRGSDSIDRDTCVLANVVEQAEISDNDIQGRKGVQGFFLNSFPSTLNDGYIHVPDVVDTITYSNYGITVDTYPSKGAYVGAIQS